MNFIQLDRYFIPIKKDEAVDDYYGLAWGRRLGGWLDWPLLLERRRVILLAEAESGKTEEFKSITNELLKQEKAAFFIPIEELADEGFEGSLTPAALEIFEKWKRGFEGAYFFLDSVDEARLNQKSFSKAIKRLARSIHADLDRSHIYISCRVTDWKGEVDLIEVEQMLPSTEKERKETVKDVDDALLGPIFSKKNKKPDEDESNDPSEHELITVRLAPLDEKQQLKLAKAVDVEDVTSFISAIWKNGLDNKTERPGDLLELAEYWATHKKFGSSAEMTEFSVNQKISESNQHRSDNTHLSKEKALNGAELVAASLTLGKTFTFKAPGHSVDLELFEGALDIKKILPKWSDAERNALIRRGVFSPATYGRVRFHHRSTQEYLTARWFDRLLKLGCPRSLVSNLIFIEVYGIKTVVTSLRSVVAWLALVPSNSDILEEVLARDPMMLIQLGDPGSLPIETRKKLLRLYAEKYKSGDISNDSIGHDALWMFSHPDLEDVIHEVWERYNDESLRGNLLILIREGNICSCSDIAADVAQDLDAILYQRIVALQILLACDSGQILKSVSENLLSNASSTSARLASGFACELFPKYIGVSGLVSLIEESIPPEKGSTDCFGYRIKNLWEKCPRRLQTEFTKKISTLALSEPYVAEYRRVSQKYRFLAKDVEPIARQLISELNEKSEPSEELIHLLMAIERVNDSHSSLENEVRLSELVQSNLKLNRSLFWADVNETRSYYSEKEEITHAYQIYVGAPSLWHLSVSDLVWLRKDIENKILLDDKKIALDATVSLLRAESTLELESGSLKKLVENSPDLLNELNKYLAPIVDSTDSEYRKKEAVRKKVRDEQKRKDQASWVIFRDNLNKAPSQLSNLKTRFMCVQNLTTWLQRRTGQAAEKAPRQWKLLNEAFHYEVAEAYKDAMKVLWRETKPQRPHSEKGGPVTTKWVSIFSFAGVGIEADESAEWAVRLTAEEAALAAKHGCMTKQGYPDWVDSLLEAHTLIALPIIIREFRVEWKSDQIGGSDFLYHYSNHNAPLIPVIGSKLFDIITKKLPASIDKLEHGIKILQGIELSVSQQKRLSRLALNRFKENVKKGERRQAFTYLALQFWTDQDKALQSLIQWIETTDPESRIELVEGIFSVLFSRESMRSNVVVSNKLRVSTLKQLIILAYRYIHPSEDNIHTGGISYRPDYRDDAESGRNSVLSALLDSNEEEGYCSVLELSELPEIGERSHRFRMLARGMVEKNADIPPWLESDTVAFEKQYVTPICTGNDLYQVVLNVLDDIRHQFEKGDASSKRLLSRLADIDDADEESVQNWLAEQLTLRADSRYHVHREAEVSNKKEPDVIVSGASGLFEVAIEVKQADSWSPAELEVALIKQLSENYLRVDTRRHGILFLTNHGRRNWRNLKNGDVSLFRTLINALSKQAEALKRNTTGSIHVTVFGLDATKSE